MNQVVKAWNHSGLSKFWMFMIVWDTIFGIFDFATGGIVGVICGTLMLFLLAVAVFMLRFTLRN